MITAAVQLARVELFAWPRKFRIPCSSWALLEYAVIAGMLIPSSSLYGDHTPGRIRRLPSSWIALGIFALDIPMMFAFSVAAVPSGDARGSASVPSAVGDEQAEQGADTEGGGPLGEVTRGLGRPARPGDVEVRPGKAVGEPQEQAWRRAMDPACPARPVFFMSATSESMCSAGSPPASASATSAHRPRTQRDGSAQ